MTRPFLIFPAIDLKDGKVVRLRQGRAEAMTVYSDDPGAMARRWEDEGARYLHVVDLDGAFEGEPRNWDSVRAILRAVQIPIQLGGGLRRRSQVEEALQMGVTRVVLGTKACDSLEFVSALVQDFGTRIVVGIDARDGLVAVKGWTEKTTVTATDFACQVSELGIQNIIFTDVSSDGMLAGPNCLAISSMCSAVTCNIIASGGIGGMDDITRLRSLAVELPNLVGAVIGKALYDGRIDLKLLEGPRR
ncbi:MAG TPA: 1-(5-phosphoribosyl)-5-[(5-phosphoribosylamino)methylideneamino]imidazole-4-carboxamide isomerase [Verrucomicrobiae bacterium]|nr:1-(5-phosphoribosyl)-5-[(5-phosphoribosylamino)methylideneamino]imidazole-4-carboxamide isomerase [Verrucomicrobiae bacterium]